MGALIRYTPDPFRPNVSDIRETPAGLAVLDAVRATFPELVDAPLIVLRGGRRLQGDELIAEGDTILVCAHPAGPISWTVVAQYAVKVLVYAAVSYLISYLFKPKTRKDKAASPAYSVAIDQNAARLGGTVPVIYGRVIAMPDIAAQAYSEFVAHNERLSMILCLGMGEFQVNDIFLGESRVVDFPPGNVQTWIFGPNDHAQTLGNIERITGVCEDMLTIPESSGVDLAAPNDPAEVSVAANVTGGVLIPNDPTQSQLWTGLVPGRPYVIRNSAGQQTIANYVGVGPNNSAVFDGPLPPRAPWIGVDCVAQLTPIDDAQEGRMMLLYSQQELWSVGIGEIIFVQIADNVRFGPFEVARSESRATRLYLRLSGPGFESATGEQGVWPQRWLSIIRNDYVLYYISEYIPGTDPSEPYRWRGWYASSRPGTYVDTLYVDIAMPNGIAWVTDKGDYKTMTTTFFVDMQQIDDNGNPIGGLRRETVRISGATSTARRVTYEFAMGYAARFRIRVGRVNNRDQRASKEISAATLGSIRARVNHPPGTGAYENCTLIVMQFNASAGLAAASNRRVTVDCTRKITNMWGIDLLPRRNPADALVDAYTEPNYGGARPQSELDKVTIARLYHQWEATPGFNGIFDQPITLLEAAQAILAPVRALPLPTGRMLSVVQDAPRPRAFLFGDDVIVKDTLSIGYNFDGEDVPDCIEVTYNDARTFVEKRVYYPFQGVRPDSMELFGCTDPQQAMDWAKVVWQDRAYNRKTCEFELEGEGYLLLPLDHFAVAVPVIAWSTPARVLQWDATSLWLVSDTPIPDTAPSLSFKDEFGRLSPPVTIAERRSATEVRLATAPPVPVFAPSETGDGSTFAFGIPDVTMFEFSASNLESIGTMRVRVVGKQYTDAAFVGTFVEHWTT